MHRRAPQPAQQQQRPRTAHDAGRRRQDEGDPPPVLFLWDAAACEARLWNWHSLFSALRPSPLAHSLRLPEAVHRAGGEVEQARASRARAAADGGAARGLGRHSCTFVF